MSGERERAIEAIEDWHNHGDPPLEAHNGQWSQSDRIRTRAMLDAITAHVLSQIPPAEGAEAGCDPGGASEYSGRSAEAKCIDTVDSEAGSVDAAGHVSVGRPTVSSTDAATANSPARGTSPLETARAVIIGRRILGATDDSSIVVLAREVVRLHDEEREWAAMREDRDAFEKRVWEFEADMNRAGDIGRAMGAADMRERAARVCGSLANQANSQNEVDAAVALADAAARIRVMPLREEKGDG